MRPPSAEPENPGETCPICLSLDLITKRSYDSDYKDQRYRLRQCEACGVQHWRPLVHPEGAYYEHEAVSMYAAMHEGRRTAADPRFEKFLAEFPALRGETMLDVGCSDGAFLAEMQRRGNTVSGIDIDTVALAAAKRRGLDDIHCTQVDAFVASARESGRRFTFITAFDVLEHLTDPLATLGQLASILAPDGRLVGTVPNRRRMLVDLQSSDFPPHHFFRFDAESIAGCLRRAGLQVDRVDTFQYGYAVITGLDALRKGLKRRLGRPRKAGGGAPLARPAPPLEGSTKQRIASAVQRSVTPASRWIEQALGRGFKLYFVARTPGTGARGARG